MTNSLCKNEFLVRSIYEGIMVVATTMMNGMAWAIAVVMA